MPSIRGVTLVPSGIPERGRPALDWGVRALLKVELGASVARATLAEGIDPSDPSEGHGSATLTWSSTPKLGSWPCRCLRRPGRRRRCRW